MEYDILSIQETCASLKVEAGRISARKNSRIQRQGVRRFEKGRIYQTSRLGPASTDRLIADTKALGGAGVPHEYGFAPECKEVRVNSSQVDDSLGIFEEGLGRLVTSYPEFVFTGRCITQNVETNLTSSYGIDLGVSGSLCDWNFIYQRKGSGNILDGYFGGATSAPNILNTISEHTEYLQAQGKVVPLKSGRMPVLIVDGFWPIYKLVESFSVNKYEEGSALYSGKLGQRLFSPRVSLVDNGYDPIHGNFQFFDGEGVVRSEDLELVKEGLFSSLISDLRFGKKHNKQSTGNGLRTYNKGVQLNPRSLRYTGGRESWKSIVQRLDRCLIALVAAGGDSNDLGEFSTPVQIGYILEKGEVIGQAPQLTVKSSVSKYLGDDLIDVSRDGFTSDVPSGCVISEMDIFV